MPNFSVSTVKEVLEQFRCELVAQLRAGGFAVPASADIAGNCEFALRAWVRVQHRSVPKARRKVVASCELRQRELDSATRAALASIRGEFEQGENLTQRLTREFYRAGFNDFLFNAFGIQHIHLGPPGAGKDRTKQHAMAGGGPALLLVLLGQQQVCFLDVLGHDIFDSPHLTKSLLQIALKNCRELVEAYVIPGASDASLDFEEAYKMAKAGFSTLFEVDGVIFGNSNVLDGKVSRKPKQAGMSVTPAEPSDQIIRSACTNSQVVDAANRILNKVVELVRFVEREVNSLAQMEEFRMRTPPIHLCLEVVCAGEVVILRERGGGLSFCNDGTRCCLMVGTSDVLEGNAAAG